MNATTAETNAPSRRRARNMQSWRRNAAKAMQVKTDRANAYQAAIEGAVIERYQTGISPEAVARSLNEAGYRTRRGCEFMRATVWRILDKAGALRRDEELDI